MFQVGGDNVEPALSLIEYDPQIHPAMQWVFGLIFICKDMETAKKVTFHARILKKSVTLDGDVFDPSGTLAGGTYSVIAFRTCLYVLKFYKFNTHRKVTSQSVSAYFDRS